MAEEKAPKPAQQTKPEGEESAEGSTEYTTTQLIESAGLLVEVEGANGTVVEQALRYMPNKDSLTVGEAEKAVENLLSHKPEEE